MEEKINIILLGNSEVGKTSFILRYTEDFFQPIYLTTIGIDFKVKNITFSNNKSYKLFFYDTTGQEKYKSISLNLIKNSDGILLMYDITKKKSFESITNWMESIKDIKEESFPIVLVGNKTDLKDKREVQKEEGKEIATKYGIDFFEISNKDGINIEESCLSLVKKIIEYKEKNIELEKDDEYEINDKKTYNSENLKKTFKEKKKKCC